MANGVVYRRDYSTALAAKVLPSKVAVGVHFNFMFELIHQLAMSLLGGIEDVTSSNVMLSHPSTSVSSRPGSA